MGTAITEALVQQRMLSWSEQVSRALFTVSCAPDLRVPIVDGGALPLLVALAKTGTEPSVMNCVHALVNLAWDDATRSKLVGAGALSALVQIVELSDNPYILYGIARVLCYLTFHEPNLRPMVEEDAVGAFARICEKLPSIQDAKRGEDGEEDHFWELGQIICLTIRLLTCSNGGQDKMLKDGVVSSCCCWRPLQTKCGC